MPCDTHPQSMSFGDHNLLLFKLDRAIDLHLLKARIVIATRPVERLFGCINTLHADRDLTRAVDYPRQQQARPDSVVMAYGIAHRGNELEFISTITDRGHTGR